MRDNLYTSRRVMIDSGTFWRCDHGFTLLTDGICWRCAAKRPVAFWGRVVRPALRDWVRP